MERLLYFPGNSFSPRTIGHLPDEARMVEVLRDHFDIDLFHHPWLKGGPDVEPEWQSYVELIRSRLTPRCHVLARPLSSPFVMLALDGNDSVGSFISIGFSPPRATLIAADLKVLADARDASVTQPIYQFAMYLKSNADEKELRKLTAMLEAEIDHERENAFDESMDQVELISLAPRVLVPTLYLHPDVQMVGMAETADLFLRLVPQTITVGVPERAERPSDGSAGDDLANAIIAFTVGLGGEAELVTALLVDIVDSTRLALEAGEQTWAEKLDSFNRIVRRETARYRGREIDNAGDGFLLAFSAPGQAVRCASAIRSALSAVNLPVRIGINSGECRIIDDKPSGLPLHLAARVAALAAPNEILASDTVRGLLIGAQFEFEDRGEHELKGIPGRSRVYALGPTVP